MSKRERYIITSAINNSPLFKEGLETLETLSKYYKAQLVVLPIYYNPYHITEEDIKYNKELTKHLITQDISIKDISILTTLGIRPTTVKPLNSLGGFEHEKHTIIAHPRLHRLDLPVSTRGQIKQLLTTGVITQPTYGNTKTGKLADFHHSFGCVIIEVENKTTHIRQVSIASDGTLCDLGVKVKGKEVSTATVEGIVYGDIHEMFLSKVVRDRGMFKEGSLLRTLNPKYVVLHDLLDTYTESHHHQNSPFTKYRISQKRTTIVDEIEGAKNLIADLISTGTTPVVVSSNHNSHLTQWLERADWRTNPRQARLILKLTLQMLDYMDKEDNIDGKTPDIFKLLLDTEFKEKVVTLGYNTSFALGTFRVDSHGDKGLNGARGMSAGIANKMTAKHIVGHAHTANRTDGILTVGVSSVLDRNYTYGLSTWSHTHAIIHDNDKAQLITQNSKTGRYTLSGQPNSIGTVLKLRQVTTPNRGLVDNTQESDDYKYKVINKEGETLGYFSGYRGMMAVTEGSEWKARTLMEKGEGYGMQVEYLEDE